MLGSWPQGLAALQDKGVGLIQQRQSEYFAVRASPKPQDFAGMETVLVLNKSWQTTRVAEQLAECLGADGQVLSLQNGRGNLETLGSKLGTNRVELGSTSYGATLVGPGQVKPGGEGIISLARGEALSIFAVMFKAAGFVVERVADTQALLWGKLVINAAINPLTALMRVPNGQLLEDPELRRQMGALAFETAQIAEAQGIELPFDDPVRAAEAVARKTAANHSSMYQDVLRGARTEIEAISGAIVRKAEMLDIPAPHNRSMWEQLRRRTG